MVYLNSDRKITENEIEEAVARPPDFGYLSDNKEMFITWSIGPIIESRDSDLLTKSNAHCLKEYLKSDPSLADDWDTLDCRHWASGWVQHLCFRAIEDNGSPTRIFKVLCAWFDDLEDYPIADEDHLGELELEAYYDNIETLANHLKWKGLLRDNLPEDWVSKVGWEIGNKYGGGIDRDDEGAECPDENLFMKVAKELGFAKEDVDISDGEEEDDGTI